MHALSLRCNSACAMHFHWQCPHSDAFPPLLTPARTCPRRMQHTSGTASQQLCKCKSALPWSPACGWGASEAGRHPAISCGRNWRAASDGRHASTRVSVAINSAHSRAGVITATSRSKPTYSTHTHTHQPTHQAKVGQVGAQPPAVVPTPPFSLPQPTTARTHPHSLPCSPPCLPPCPRPLPLFTRTAPNHV